MWDIFQEIRLNDLRAQQGDTNSSLKSASGDINELNRHVRKLALVSQALYELLKESTGITDEDLRRRIEMIDKRDGVTNGRIDATPLKCPKCGGVVTAGALSCQTCGAMAAPKYPFEA
ncbi:MAG: hypothetical protein NWT08_07785 [Akkermansiaceae bacterium]|jgi:hypothetical protein|nr:hypothetical protein [Akkermansiaceae bacterium]MDP4646843.1 hypothetical protein [Akkermansiaceae bacterium]MDP4719820.1 hypothetical protein [Akkermansiaceae bacterium]MDP4780981.1 hypothetical protein [Akkermansiaceae bacterium]MDP4846822.1 hypothetical protein [Akkermansiaceae bacterium]